MNGNLVLCLLIFTFPSLIFNFYPSLTEGLTGLTLRHHHASLQMAQVAILISYVDIRNTIDAVGYILECILEFPVIVLFGRNFSGSAVGRLLY